MAHTLPSTSQLCLPSTAPNSAILSALTKCCTPTIKSISPRPTCYFCPSTSEKTSLRDCLSELGINLDGDEEENRLELRGFIDIAPELGDGAEGAEGAEGAGGEVPPEEGGGGWEEGGEGEEGSEGDEEGGEGEEGGDGDEDECQSYTSSVLGPVCNKGKKNGTSQIGEDGSGSGSGSGSGDGQLGGTNTSTSLGSTIENFVSEAHGRGVGWIGSGLVWGLFLFVL